jgi:putative protease
VSEEIKNLEDWKEIGRVTHYFGNIGVAVLKLDDSLRVGDTIRIVGGVDTDFEQVVDSMEIDHQRIEQAKKGDELGLKVKERVREGYRVFKAK